MSLVTTSSSELKLRGKEHETYLTTKEKTFQYDNDLPNLPVPPLHQTLQRYLKSVRPHANEEEFERTKEVVSKFESGIGKELHQKLLEYAGGKKNWLDDWWLHYAYLTFREPILPLVNTTGPHPLNETIWKPNLEKGMSYGALYLWCFLKYNLLLREQQIKPHKSKDGKALSMHQFRYVFNCTRIPGQNADSLYSCWKTKDEGECPLHITVLCHGHIWTLYPWHISGEPLNPPELEVQLKYIREQSDAMGMGPGISVLTCDKRDNWAENRDWLKSQSLNNMKTLELIESSMFVFVLDDSIPQDTKESLWVGLCGDTSNRWADKSLSAILTKNGVGIMNNDHTPYDAMVSVMMAHFQYLLLLDMGGEWSGSEEIRNMETPTLLNFDLDAKLCGAIKDAKETSLAYVNNIEVEPYQMQEYGRDFLRPFKLHPDSYVQTALQLTYTRLHGQTAPTYETATIRQFYKGRTETIRSATIESSEFVNAMLNPGAKNAERRQKLISAINKHNEVTSECQKCEGVDRHLFGLYIVALQNGIEIPDIFTDHMFTKSGGGGNYALSTSTIGYTPVYGGVSAMTPDGYGVFYAMLPKKFKFFVSNFKSSSVSDGKKFVSALRQSLADMKEVLLQPNSSL